MGIKYSVNENFFNRWNPEMAYVLGYLYADGSLEDASYMRGKYIRVTSVDQYTIQKIKRWLHSQHTITVIKPTGYSGYNRKIRYLLRIGSHKLYYALTRLGLYPNKSLTIQFPKVPHKYLGDFVRGYFDGDGCVVCVTEEGKTKRQIVKRLRVIFTSGSKAFLEQLSFELASVEKIQAGRIYKNHGSFQLRYSTTDSIALFKILYNNTSLDYCLVRKFSIFKKYFKLREQRVDRKIAKILRMV